MGVELCMWQITPENLEKLSSSEETIEAFMESQFPDPDSPDAVTETLTEDDGMELGKTWHFLHYLITGDAKSGEYPLGYAVMIGHPFNKYLSDLTWRSPDEVQDIADALANISEKELLKKRNPPKTSKIQIYDYPAGFKKKDIEEVLPYFRKLRGYYSAAAKQGNAMLVHVG
ncbi:MAG: YfbM family protein [Desulfatiglandales bacterium]